MPAPLGKILFLLLLVCGVAAIDTYAATLTVTKTEDTNDGVCDTDCSLREAVAVAVSGDTVVFSSLFNSPQTITLILGQIAIDKNLTITGTGQDLVTISGNNASRIFFISNNVNVMMSEMKLRDGKVQTEFSAGGAILIIGGSLNLTEMEFTNNTAFYEPLDDGYGAAVYGSNSTVTLADLNVHHNISPAGALYVFPGAIIVTDSVIDNNTIGIQAQTLTISNAMITNNSSGGVGGAQMTVTSSTIEGNGLGIAGGSDTTLTVEDSTISGNMDSGLVGATSNTIRDTSVSNNVRLDYGGGIVNSGTMYIVNSAITGNEAGSHGGGIATYGPLFLTNSTVSGNIAHGAISTAGYGGGIYVFGTSGRLTMTNSTVYNNQSKGAGGGVRRDNTQPTTIRNSIIAGNSSTQTSEEDVSGAFVSEGTNLIGNTMGSSGWISTDLLNTDPMLGPLADNGGGTMTHALLNGSQALDAGNNSLAVDPQTQAALTGDQRGFQRFVAGTVDIGAFEVQPLITGTITYGNAVGPPAPRFVSSVLITGVGSPSVFTTSIADGSYTLGGFGTSSYTVTPSKTGGVIGISSFDAGLIARHVVGIELLMGNQLIVADVSGNGTISSFDAANIAAFVTGLNNFGSTGNWVFMPANRFYPSVTSTLTGEDFIALLMGDVSGNWTDQGGRTTGARGPLAATPVGQAWLRR